MIRNNIILYTLIIFLITLLSACGDRFVTASGYSPEEPTKERIDKLFKETIENMVFVEGGNFMMGCIDSKNSLESQILEYVKSKKAKDQHFFFDLPPVSPCKPQNEVKLDSYSMGKFEVSFNEYDLFTQATGLPFLQEYKFHLEVKLSKDKDIREGDKSAYVGWHQANRYCEWLSKKTGLDFALPTEAQWEYAARSRGRDVAFATDTGYWDIENNYPTFDDEKSLVAQSTKYPPNPLGIYHMTDLKTEWVKDWYTKNYNNSSLRINPQGPINGTEKVLRGGNGSPQGRTVWDRWKKTPVWNKKWTELMREAKEEGENIEMNIENPTKSDFGFRCALNKSKLVTIKDIVITDH